MNGGPPQFFAPISLSQGPRLTPKTLWGGILGGRRLDGHQLFSDTAKDFLGNWLS